ncbi:pantoate--beta-alanine ligase, partial [Desulfobacterales bacterium HSG17]|nr:pantoate--beta-alanine ligase [Desulfobacterales bacterium HSG17]
MQTASRDLRRDGKRIGFVPTMGFLHQGHLSLMQIARQNANVVIASIFVNPTQFGPNEDFSTYPKNLESDFALLAKAGVTGVFTPNDEMMYPKHYQTYVSLDQLPNHLCGISRPEHFKGVATIVAKLFNIVRPHVAVFGEKDYQQLAVIRRLTMDLNFDIQIMGGPIIRESDGLAMSSRNQYLLPDERKAATCLKQAIENAQKQIRSGETRGPAVITAAEKFITSLPHTKLDDIRMCHTLTFERI